MPGNLVLTRHTESEFNARNLFTGWADPPLTAQGVAEATELGERFKRAGIHLHAAYSSALGRARQCTEAILDRLEDRPGYMANAALNERDYGELTGLDKTQAAARWGERQIRRWRRSYAEAPPKGASLRDTAARVLPFYLTHILPSVMDDRTTLVVAHGNSLRGLVMALEQITPQAIADLEIATGEVRIYGFKPNTTISACERLR